MKYLYELSNEDVIQKCLHTPACDKCELRINGSVCAKDLIVEGTDLIEWFKVLTKEIDINENTRTDRTVQHNKEEMGNKRETRESNEECELSWTERRFRTIT